MQNRRNFPAIAPELRQFALKLSFNIGTYVCITSPACLYCYANTDAFGFYITPCHPINSEESAGRKAILRPNLHEALLKTFN